MFSVKRSQYNPILKPGQKYQWENSAAFNWSVVKDKKDKKVTHAVYRALSKPHLVLENHPYVSTIGYAKSTDGIFYRQKKQLIKPEFEWEKYGCEDPRVTEIDGKYYIFYTALSVNPFRYFGIKTACAITKDFKTIDSKHLVTPFNSKAMAFFPGKIDKKLTAILTVHTDNTKRVSRIAIAQFDCQQQMWDIEYWRHWYKNLKKNALSVRRAFTDHVEVGAAPVKIKEGWLLVYSHIQNYLEEKKIFGIEALLLDSKNPRKIIARTNFPIMVPEESYEQYGQVPKVVFPSGALVIEKELNVFYGAADTTCCVAKVNLANLLKSMQISERKKCSLRFKGNPVLSPLKANYWESKAVFNPAAIDLEGKIHIVYRAMSEDNTSTMGYASTADGLNISQRLPEPIYTPRLDFEIKKVPGGNSGCEDPRIVKVGSRIYMFYTAYNGIDVPRVALSSIAVKDFLNKKWNWSSPVLVTPAGIDDKDASIFPEKFDDKYCFIHRINHQICIDYISSLKNALSEPMLGIHLMGPRYGMWDSKKIGLAGNPIKTKSGWIMFYHGIGQDCHYRLGAALLSLKNPLVVLARTNAPLLEPLRKYEKQGQVPNVVFPCSHILRGDTIYHYYGGGDSVVAVATQKLSDLLAQLS